VDIAQPVHHLIQAVQAAATATATTPAATATSSLSSAPTDTSSSSGGGLTSSLTGLIGVVVFFFVLFLIIFHISLIFWTWRDVRSRTQDVILQVVATLLVAVFDLGGLFIYVIVRPRQTLAELYERQLEEESLLAEMTERSSCPNCHFHADADFQICPNCGTKLRRPCPRCEHLLELSWNICPYCGYGGGGGVDGRAPARARAER
jgi:RNA polymerase subunit RPABC4/transcription elongation factor Spt4